VPEYHQLVEFEIVSRGRVEHALALGDARFVSHIDYK